MGLNFVLCVLITKVSYASVCFFLWFDEISVFEAGKTRKRIFARSIHFHGGWLRRSSVLTVLVETERVSVCYQEVTLESCVLAL